MDRFVVRKPKEPEKEGHQGKPSIRGSIAKRPSSRGSRAGYFAARTAKQQEQAPKARTDILRGVNIYFTGVFTHSQFRLTRLVHENGGTVAPMWSRRSVTHVVCDRLAASKINKELNLKAVGRANSTRSWIVKPQWVVDSVEGGRKLSETKYRVIRDRQLADMHKLLQSPGVSSSAKRGSCQMSGGGVVLKSAGIEERPEQGPKE